MFTRLIGAKEASVILDIRLPRLYELVRLKAIPCVHLGRRQIRFSLEALEEWAKNGGMVIAQKERTDGK